MKFSIVDLAARSGRTVNGQMAFAALFNAPYSTYSLSRINR